VIAIAGPFSSGCAAPEIPILNGAPGGPLANRQPDEYVRRPYAQADERFAGARCLLPHPPAQFSHASSPADDVQGRRRRDCGPETRR